MDTPRRLENKVVLLVGSGPSINAGIGHELAREGASVVCVDINAEFADACAAGLRRQGAQAIAVKADSTVEAEVVAAVDAARKTFGKVDILVNGAVLQIRKGILDMEVGDFRKVVDVALTGAFLFTKHVARLMVEQGQGGSIINLVSTEGHQGNCGNIAYGTAKAGLLNFTRAAAMEFAPMGIRVNSLTPTATDSQEGRERAAEWGVQWEEVRPQARADVSVGDQGIPLGRRPTPTDYGRAAAFLASEDARMVTGIDLRVDGGVIARYWRWNPGTPVAASTAA